MKEIVKDMFWSMLGEPSNRCPLCLCPLDTASQKTLLTVTEFDIKGTEELPIPVCPECMEKIKENVLRVIRKRR